MLTHTLRERGDVLVITLSGRLTLGAGDRALREVVERVLAGGGRSLVLDLSRVEFIDSSGLGELVGALRSVRAAGGRLKILNPGGRVYDTLSLARLLPLFEVFSSEDDVVASFAVPAEEVAGPDLLYEHRDRAALLTLNRPRRFNALTRRMLSELVAAVAAAARDRKVRALVLTGAGRAFCYGADVDELREAEGALPTLELFQTAVRDLAGLPKPVLAAVNGFATGAGLDLALACDLRVMSDRAKLSSAFIRFGLVPDGGSTHLLPRLVGAARAMELVLTGRAIDADEALRWGLANRVVAAKEVVERTLEWANELALGPARAMGRAKLLVRTGAGSDLATALAAEARDQAISFADGEFHEGLRAHLEKRDASFPE